VNVGDNASTTSPGPVYAKAAPSKIAPGDGGGSSNAVKLVDREYRITAFTVNAGRLFWLTIPEIIENGPSAAGAGLEETFNTCVVANCAGTVKTYSVDDADGVVFGGPNFMIATNASEAFWSDTDQSKGIAHCPKSGCVTPEYLSTGQGTPPFFVVDDTTFYFANGILASCAIGNCAASAQRFAMMAPAGAAPFGGTNAVVLDGDYLYMADYPAGGGGRLLRTRKDGTGTFDVLASNVSEAGLVARNGALYWDDGQALGSVFTCPETGCVGAPRTVVGNLAALESIAVDDDYVYLTYPANAGVLPGNVPNTDEVLRCPISGCDQPTAIAASVGIDGLVAVDDAYVYFVGTDCDGLEQTPQYFTDQCAYIAAVPK
jgi:hypothetical protein